MNDKTRKLVFAIFMLTLALSLAIGMIVARIVHPPR